MSYGYIQDDIQKEDYIFGSSKVTGNILAPNGDWTPYLPPVEYQSRPTLETSACVTFGTQNALEMLLKRSYLLDVNLSERYVAKLTGTTQEGNSPQKVIEYIRRYIGTIPESYLPFTDGITTWEQFYSGVKLNHLLVGIQWIWVWKVQHEWVDGTPEAMKDALKFSPLGVAVQAWSRENGIYMRFGHDNHWCVMVGYKDKDYWLVYDTYDETIKKLDWNYGFSRVKRYHIERRENIDLKTLGRMAMGLTKYVV